MLIVALLVWLGVRASSGPAPARGPSIAALFEPPQDEVVPPPTGDAADEHATGATPQPDPEAPPERDPRAASRDRLAGLLGAMGSIDLPVALAAARSAAGLDLLDAERSELERVQGGLDLRVENEVVGFRGRAERGEVLRAHQDLRALLAADPNAVGELVVRHLPALDAPTGENAQLPRGIEVRWLELDGTARSGELVSARGEQVSVRVREQSGFRFPSMARSAIEPATDDVGHARAQCDAARAAGEDLLARLWSARVAALSR